MYEKERKLKAKSKELGLHVQLEDLYLIGQNQEDREDILERIESNNIKLDEINEKIVRIGKIIRRILKILWENKLLILQNCTNDKKLKKTKIQWQF